MHRLPALANLAAAEYVPQCVAATDGYRVAARFAFDAYHATLFENHAGFLLVHRGSVWSRTTAMHWVNDLRIAATKRLPDRFASPFSADLWRYIHLSIREARACCRGAPLWTVGHSLGGAIALTQSALFGLPAVTFCTLAAAFPPAMRNRLDPLRVLNVRAPRDIASAVAPLHGKELIVPVRTGPAGIPWHMAAVHPLAILAARELARSIRHHMMAALLPVIHGSTRYDIPLHF